MEKRIIDIELLHKVLFKIKRPSQYIGSEINSILKDEYSSLITFIYPDTYEVGMSHLGGSLLYNIINGVEGVSCQRAFMPELSMLKVMKEYSIPLFTLEEKIEVACSDSVMFSMLYELNITNVLELLSLSSVPIYSDDRKEHHPIIIAGGSTMINPTPIAPFFDCIVIGDGEEVIVEISQILKETLSRAEKITKISKLNGVWVPGYGKYSVNFRRVSDIEGIYPTNKIVPNIRAIHDRISVEVMRGCVRGCRYCNAGMIYRPFREKSVENIMCEVIDSHLNTGMDEVGYLSLSTTDYSGFSDLILSTVELKNQMGINFAIPSTRLDKMPHEMKELDFAKNSLTLAPECGTDRLRYILNKNITNEEIINSVSYAYENGWQTIKLYFMVGLPFEQDEDIDGMIDLIREITSLAYKKSKSKKSSVNVSLGAFTPRPLTPFQWSAYESIDTLMSKFKRVKSAVLDRKVKVFYRDPYISLIETLLTRGDEQVSGLIYRVWEKGGILQAWDEHVDKYMWMDSAKEIGLDIDAILNKKSMDEILPWSFINSGVKDSYLKDEYNKASSENMTEDCKYGSCSSCGICNDKIKNVSKESVVNLDMVIPEQYKNKNHKYIVRLVSTQKGESVYLSTKDYWDKIKKALIVSGVPLVYSEGFAHKIRASFSNPNTFGVFSEYEYSEFETYKPITDDIIEKINCFLNHGIDVVSYSNSDVKYKQTLSDYNTADFEIMFVNDDAYRVFKDSFDEGKTIYEKKNKKGQLKQVDAKANFIDIIFLEKDRTVYIKMFTFGDRAVRLDLLIQATNNTFWLDICKVTKKKMSCTPL